MVFRIFHLLIVGINRIDKIKEKLDLKFKTLQTLFNEILNRENIVDVEVEKGFANLVVYGSPLVYIKDKHTLEVYLKTKNVAEKELDLIHMLLSYTSPFTRDYLVAIMCFLFYQFHYSLRLLAL